MRSKAAALILEAAVIYSSGFVSFVNHWTADPTAADLPIDLNL